MAKNQAATFGKGIALPSDIRQAFNQSETFYKTELQQLNGSGISGEVLLAFDEDTIGSR